MTVGTKVNITIPQGEYLLECRWIPGPALTGTIQRLFKDSRAAVAIDQLRNRSQDGRRTLHLPLAWMSEQR